MTAGANLVDQAFARNPKADFQAIIRYVSSGVWRLLLNYLFAMLIRTRFFALPSRVVNQVTAGMTVEIY
jgi:hypothetical protein